MRREKQYVIITKGCEIPDIEKIEHLLKKENLANVIIENRESIELSDLEAIGRLLAKCNGLAVLYGENIKSEVKSLVNEFVIELPTKHEAVEAVMMNILENQFLNSSQEE